MYKDKCGTGYENSTRAIFQGAGEYDIPILKGYKEMIERLQPETIIFYGRVPEECMGNIINIKSFQEKFRRSE